MKNLLQHWNKIQLHKDKQRMLTFQPVDNSILQDKSYMKNLLQHWNKIQLHKDKQRMLTFQPVDSNILQDKLNMRTHNPKNMFQQDKCYIWMMRLHKRIHMDKQLPWKRHSDNNNQWGK
jgi:hypothetical protein